MASLLGRIPSVFNQPASAADVDELDCLSDGDVMFIETPPTSSKPRPSSNPYSAAYHTASPRQVQTPPSSHPSKTHQPSRPKSVAGTLALLNRTPKVTSARAGVSGNVHIQISHLTERFCSTEDDVGALDARLTEVERLPARFGAMLDGVVEKLRGEDRSDTFNELERTLQEVRTSIEGLRGEVEEARIGTAAIAALRREVEELKQGSKRYGKEREREENGVAEELARERALAVAREALREQERASEKRERDALRERLAIVEASFADMKGGYEELKKEQAKKHEELVKRLEQAVPVTPAVDAERGFQPVLDKLNRLQELFEESRPVSTPNRSGRMQSPRGMVPDSAAFTVDPRRFMSASPSDAGGSGLFDNTDGQGEGSRPLAGLTAFMDMDDFVNDDGQYTDTAGAAPPVDIEPEEEIVVEPRERARTASEDHVENDPSLGQEIQLSPLRLTHNVQQPERFEALEQIEQIEQAEQVEQVDTDHHPDPPGGLDRLIQIGEVELGEPEQVQADVGGSSLVALSRPGETAAEAALEDDQREDSSDESLPRPQTPTTADLAVLDAYPSTQIDVHDDPLDAPGPSNYKRSAPGSVTDSFTSHNQSHKRQRRSTASNASSQSQQQEASQSPTALRSRTSMYTTTPNKKRKPVAKPKSKGVRKNVVPIWRMNVRSLAVSDGSRRGTGEWPPKVEYTVKGRAQEIICDVCKGRAHWFCAGFEDDAPAPEGEWHCPDCREKLAKRIPRGTIETAPQNRCIRYNCLLKAKIRTVRKEGDAEEWYPERIVGRKAILRNADETRVFHYLMKWIDYDIVESTWEPVENFASQTHMIDDFMTALAEEGIKTKPRVNLLPEAAKYFDMETTELKPEYAESEEE